MTKIKKSALYNTVFFMIHKTILWFVDMVTHKFVLNFINVTQSLNLAFGWRIVKIIGIG